MFCLLFVCLFCKWNNYHIWIWKTYIVIYLWISSGNPPRKFEIIWVRNFARGLWQKEAKKLIRLQVLMRIFKSFFDTNSISVDISYFETQTNISQNSLKIVSMRWLSCLKCIDAIQISECLHSGIPSRDVVLTHSLYHIFHAWTNSNKCCTSLKKRHTTRHVRMCRQCHRDALIKNSSSPKIVFYFCCQLGTAAHMLAIAIAI